jgi:hypothetical protein
VASRLLQDGGATEGRVFRSCFGCRTLIRTVEAVP